MTQKNRYTKNRRTKNRMPKKLSLRKRKQTKKYRKKRGGGGQRLQNVLTNSQHVMNAANNALKNIKNFQQTHEDAKLKKHAENLLGKLPDMIENLPDGPVKKDLQKLHQLIQNLINKPQNGGHFSTAIRFPYQQPPEKKNNKSTQSTQDVQNQLNLTIDNLAKIFKISEDVKNNLMNELKGHENELKEIIKNNLNDPEQMQKKINELLDRLDIHHKSGGSRIPDISTKSHIRMFAAGSYIVTGMFTVLACTPPFTPICIGMLVAGGFLVVNSSYTLSYRAIEQI